MAMMCNDASLGPTSSCRFFDFTLTFQSVLLLASSCPIVLVCIFELARLPAKPTLVQQRKSLFRSQILRHIDAIGLTRCLLALIHALIAVAMLAVVASSSRLTQTLAPPLITPALSLSMVSALLLVPYTLLARLKQPNGSLLIPIYLFATCLVDACRIRTYFGVPALRQSPYTRLSIALAVVKFLMLAAENTSGIQTMHSTKEGSASFLSKMLFWWLKDVVWTGFRRPLEMVNLDNLPPDFEGRMLGARLSTVYNQEAQRSSGGLKNLLSKRSIQRRERGNHAEEEIEMDVLNNLPGQEPPTPEFRPNLLWVCFKAFPLSLIAPVAPKICMSGITLSLPFLIRNTLAFAESQREPNMAQPTAYGWGLVGAYAFVYLVLAFSTGQFYWTCDKSQVKLRGALLDMIYRKSLRMHLSTARTTGGGAAANLMAVDLERFVRAIIPFHNLWSGLVLVVVSSFLLYVQLGLTFIATLASIILCLAFPPIASRGVGGRQARWSEATDKRVNLTSSAISNAKGVKFMAYENTIVQKLLDGRQEELKRGWSYYKQLLVISGFTNLVTDIMALFTFTTLAIVDYVTGSDRLNVSTVVTSLTLMQLLEAPLLQMGQNYGSIIAALVSLNRIQDFLVTVERPEHSLSRSGRTSQSGSFGGAEREAKIRQEDSLSLSSLDSNVAASFRSTSIGWSSDKPVLINISLDIPFHCLTIVCGTLASGKSTLLQSLLGETNIISGALHLPIKREPIAYVAQDGWLQEGATIHDNIIFDSPFDAERYQTIIQATALDVDFEELPMKDRSLAKALSGGQRQRLTLARALYADAASYVLDDFTSALDAETASHVWRKLMGPTGLLKGKTVIMATNALQLLSQASFIIRLDAGMIVESGAYEDLSEKGKSAISRISMQSERPEEEKPIKAPKATLEEKEDDKHEEVESGAVKWSIYGYWFKAIGLLYVTIALGAMSLRVGGVMGWNTFLQFWSRDTGNDDTLRWMGGFIGLVTLAMLFFPIGFFTLCYAALVKAGRRLHELELRGVFGTSLSFFEENASGRIINRFSQDLFVLDWEIILALVNFMGSLLELFAQIVILLVPVPYLTVVVFVVSILYFGIQRLYAPASRQLRRLEMATKSPIYTLFAETSTPSGLATIRGLNRQELFIDINIGRLNRSQQPYFYLQAVRRWLQTWLNMFSLVINVGLVSIVVLMRNTSSISVLGVGLVQATNISLSLNQTLISFTELEIASVALERVFAFAKLPKEQDEAVNGKLRVKIKAEDVRGEIEFRNVSIAYKPGLPPALKDLSLTIRPGEKLGICGRSGSGKSTMLLAIFAMLEASQGDIYLDGEPISQMSAFSLRNSLTIVPQNALVLTATVRENLDPEREKSDAEIWDALQTCQLLDVVKMFPDGLSTLLANDIDLSAGQRQLFSLARALLRKRKVLVLDEATSSMDYQTDAAVQEVLRTQFNGCTILTVAHRIATVRDYDRILVLSAGRLVELDGPDALMRQPDSIFRSLAIEQGVQ